MCSFLLLFLLLFVGSDLIQNSNTNWNTEKAQSAAKAKCTSRLVLTSEGSGDFEPGTPEKSQADIVCPSFQRQQFFAAHFQADRGDGVVALAVHKLPENQQKTSYKVCALCRTLDEWYSSQYSAQTTAAASGECQLERMGRMVPGVGRLGKSWCIPTMGQITIEVSVSSQHKECKIRCIQDSEEPQRDERPEQGKRQRRKRQSKRLCQCFDLADAFCTIGDRASTMAVTRQYGIKSYAFSCSYIIPLCSITGQRDNCAKEGGGDSFEDSIHRSCHDAAGHKRFDSQNGSRYREDGKGTFKSDHQEFALSHNGAWQGTEDVNRDVGGQACPQSSLDQACDRSCKDLGGPAPRISSTTGISAGKWPPKPERT